MCVCVCVCVEDLGKYNGEAIQRLRRSYDSNGRYMISAVDDFFTNGIQALQHRWKKCEDCKGDYVEE